MLTITHDAADLLVHMRQLANAPETFGPRLFAATPPGSGEASIAVAFVPQAEPGDQVTEQEGLTAFVAADVVDALNDATIDASPADGGEELVIRR